MGVWYDRGIPFLGIFVFRLTRLLNPQNRRRNAILFRMIVVVFT